MVSQDDLIRVRSLGPSAIVSDRYPDDAALESFLESHGGNVDLAIGLLWEERVAQTSRFVDIREGSSQRAMRQEFENATKMAERYLSLGGQSGLLKPTRIHTIER